MMLVLIGCSGDDKVFSFKEPIFALRFALRFDIVGAACNSKTIALH